MPVVVHVVIAVIAVLLAFGAGTHTQDPPAPTAAKQGLGAGAFGGLRLRGIGLALMSGRIADIAIDPVASNTWYVAAGSGNLWKTTSDGATWTPIFEN